MRFRKWCKAIVFSVLFLSFALVVFFYLFAPLLVEKIATERLRQIPGLSGVNLDIRSIGFSGADIREITTGKSLLIDTVHVDYSISSLIKRRVEQVMISGLELRGEITPSGLKFADFSQERNSTQSDSPVTSNIGDFFALLPDKIRVTNSVVSISMDNQNLRLPFEVLSSVAQNENRIKILMELFPYGEMVEAAFTATSAGIETVEIFANGFGLAHLNPLVDLFAPGVILDGRADLLLSKTTKSDWVVTLSGMGIDKPMALTIGDIVCRVKRLSPLSVEGSLVLENSMVQKVPVNFSGTLAPDNGWNLAANVGSGKQKEYKLVLGGKELVVINPSMDIKVRGKGIVGEMEFSAGADKCKGKLEDMTAMISRMILTGDANFDLKGDQDRFDMTFAAKSGSVEIVSGDLYGKAPSVDIPGRLTLDSKFIPRISVTPTVTGAEAGSSSLKALAREISFTIPVSFPFIRSGDTGKYRVAELIHDRQKLGEFNGTIDQTDEGITSRGRVDLSKVLGNGASHGFDVNLKARLVPSLRVEAKLDMGKQQISSRKISSHYLPKGSDLEFTFRMDAFALLLFEKNRASCRFDINVTQGEVSSKEKNLNVTGINASLGFDDLFSFRSRPGQNMTVDSIRIADIAISDAALDFTIESMESLLVEHAGFKWCDGSVSTESMRIISKKDDYRLNLFCDRLKLSEILRQVGSFKAEGDGTLNGSIPVVYSKGEISFNNGFLFSTPGRGGKIRVHGTEVLTAGIPRDSFQFNQIDLAREALKDYQYNWAKLTFNTKGETLFVKMEFDGEPANVLPFVYKKEIGGFVRVSASSQGSKFQGIKIDVNLEVPFNRVMKFGNKLNRMIN